MPRLAGQVDETKTEAILDAASLVFGERGLSAPVAEIACRAGVSKQTIYNRFGSKAELMRALVERRVNEITEPLHVPGAAQHPQKALAGFGRVMLQAVLNPRGHSLLRVTVQGAADLPDLARAFFEGGPVNSRRQLAEFLRQETAAGRMAVDDPALAAEFFASMVSGSHQLAGVLGVGQAVSEAEIDRIAAEAAARFMRAYAA